MDVEKKKPESISNSMLKRMVDLKKVNSKKKLIQNISNFVKSKHF